MKNINEIEVDYEEIISLSNPKTSRAEVLHHLITNGYVSIMDFPYMSGFRTRVSEFYTNNKLITQKKNINAVNKYKNVYTYVMHILPESERKKAISLYYSINK